MKTCIVLIFVFVGRGHFNVSAQKPFDTEKEGYVTNERLINNNENNQGILNNNKYFTNEDKINEDDNDDDPGNPDTRAVKVRPCSFFDRFCIRKFFAEHSKCKIVPGPVIEPFFAEENQLYFPNSNVTVTIRNTWMSGLNGIIEEFYVNKVTGNLVLAVFFKDLKVLANPAFFRFNRNGQEPVETMAEAAIDYLKFTVTIIIPNFNKLRLEDAEINGYLDDPFPPFFIGPSALESTDPNVFEEFASLLANVPTAAVEHIFLVAPLAAKIFIQKSICDFGVPINRI